MTDTFTQGLQRLPTGVAGLDVILEGGLFRRGIYQISGNPGTGKTILGSQIGFHHVASGSGDVVFITLLTETHADLFAYLKPMQFFQPDYISQHIFYFNGYGALEQGGLRGLIDFIKGVIAHNKPTMLILDALSTVEFMAESADDFRKFIQQLHVYLQVNRCTALLLTHDGNEDHPEYMMIDGLIKLNYPLIGQRSVRYLRISKFRGSGFLQGQHIFEITDNGIIVYPRTEALLAVPELVQTAPTGRIGFGIQKFDAMIGGGLLISSVTMTLGIAGSGKTILGLHFLSDGLRNNEPVLYFGFYEMPAYLVETANRLGFEFSEKKNADLLTILWYPPRADSIDIIIEQLLAVVQQKGIKRLFIDGLAGLQQALDTPTRFKQLLIALTNQLRALGVTTLISVELPNLFGPTVETPGWGLATLADNILLLRTVEQSSQLRGLISILKMRSSKHESSIHEFSITDHGIELGGLFQNTTSLVTGNASQGEVVNGSVSRRGEENGQTNSETAQRRSQIGRKKSSSS